MAHNPINALPWRKQGYSIHYHTGEANHCPGCGHRHWIVGRLMAECAFCGTALPLMHVHGYGSIQNFVVQNGQVDALPEELRAVA